MTNLSISFISHEEEIKQKREKRIKMTPHTLFFNDSSPPRVGNEIKICNLGRESSYFVSSAQYCQDNAYLGIYDILQQQK